MSRLSRADLQDPVGVHRASVQHPGDRRRKVIRALELSFHYTAKDFNNDQIPMGTEIVSIGY